MRGDQPARDDKDPGVIDVLDENWDIVQAYTLCGWTVTQTTIPGPHGMPIVIPQYLGISATEMQAACDAIGMPGNARGDTYLGIQLMASVAAKLLNERSKR